MPNERKIIASPTPSELLQRSFLHPGVDSLPVRVVAGQVTYGLPGYGQQRVKSVAGAGDEALPSSSVDINNLLAGERAILFAGAANFSSVRLYLRFTAAGSAVAFGNGSSATVTAYHINDNGEVVEGKSFANLGHQDEVVDDGGAGRKTFYRISSTNFAGGADGLGIRLAGEGLGYRE